MRLRGSTEVSSRRAAGSGPAICDLEIGCSAQNEHEWDRLASALAAFDLVETTAQHVTRSLQVQRLLVARSQRGRKLPDLLIAAAAEALNLVVLHYDSEFDFIGAVTGQQCQWAVQAGSIDWPIRVADAALTLNRVAVRVDELLCDGLIAAYSIAKLW